MFTAKAEKQKEEEKVEKTGKKAFFQGERAKNLFIAITRLPPVETIIDAVDRMNEKNVSIDNLQALDSAWPVDEFDQLIEEATLNKNTTWDKAETYFIALGKKPKFQFRIKAWMFKMKFDKTFNDLITWQDLVLSALKIIIANENLRKVLGAVLRFGNCLNAGNKSRGQADGFDLKDL